MSTYKNGLNQDEQSFIDYCQSEEQAQMKAPFLKTEKEGACVPVLKAMVKDLEKFSDFDFTCPNWKTVQAVNHIGEPMGFLGFTDDWNQFWSFDSHDMEFKDNELVMAIIAFWCMNYLHDRAGRRPGKMRWQACQILIVFYYYNRWVGNAPLPYRKVGERVVEDRYDADEWLFPRKENAASMLQVKIDALFELLHGLNFEYRRED